MSKRHVLHRLTVNSVKNAKPGRHTDGGGLILNVRPSGKRSWLLRVQNQPTGQRREIGLGPFPEVTLAEAREEAAKLRKAARKGENPVAVRDAPKKVAHTFKTAMEETHEALSPGWSAKTAASFKQSLEDHVVPRIGDLPIDKIGEPEIIYALAPTWVAKPQLSRKLRAWTVRVLRHAKSRKWRTQPLPDAGELRDGLGKQPEEGHFAALPFKDVPAFIADQLDREETASRLGLIFTVLTVARSGETRGATWDEIDLAAREWRIPANRMKARREHVVPLSAAAVTILERARELFGDAGFVFPGSKAGRPMTDMTMSGLLRTLKLNATVHGMRSAFRDWVAEETDFPGELAELSIAHVAGSKTVRAYQRSNLLGRRRPLMAAWGAFCAPALSAAPTNIIEISGGAQAA